MPADRFYHSSIPGVGESLNFEGTELHHLVKVMRVRIGERIELMDGQGTLAEGTLEEVGRRQARVLVTERQSVARPTRQLTILQALPRPNRIETILEKGTELGVDQFLFFPGARSEKKDKDISDSARKRMETIVLTACKQCGRLYKPEIRFIDPIKAWKTLPVAATFFGDFRSDAPHFFSAIGELKELAFVVGPEAGLNEHEVTKLIELGAKGASLHKNILRTDTASLVVASLFAAAGE